MRLQALILYTFLLFPAFTQSQNRRTPHISNAEGMDYSCEDCSLTIYPQASDFAPGQEGKVLIATRDEDSNYHSPYQTEDGKILLRVVLAASCANQIVYLKVIDPDDLSPYESDDWGNDNLDLNATAGAFGGVPNIELVAQGGLFNHQQVALVEVELQITAQYSGDNYQVWASLDPGFPEAETIKSPTYVAWKRLYVELDLMYRYGATLVKQHNSDADSDPDWLEVDNVDDFSPGQQITLFRAGHSTTSTTTVLGKESINGLHRLKVADLNTYYPQWAGIKIEGPGFESTVAFSNELIEQSFGSAPQGQDCGAFVEWPIWDFGDSGLVPKYKEFEELLTARYFMQVWFSKSNQNQNVVYILGALNDNYLKDTELAYAEYPINVTIYFEEKFSLDRKSVV